MKTIGLIGGLTWHSTLEYYRVINEEVRRIRGGHASARIALQSLDFAEIRACQLRDDWAAAGRLLAQAGTRCRAGGADLLLICSNLMHKNVEAVGEVVDIPVLHIADAVAARVRADGHRKIGLLGTRWVMEEDFYIGRLRAAGIDVVVPDAAGRDLVDRVIFEELTQGVTEDRSRAAFAGLVRTMADDGAQAVVLGCTEIELLIGPDDCDLPVLDSMRVHAEGAVAAALATAAGAGRHSREEGTAA